MLQSIRTILRSAAAGIPIPPTCPRNGLEFFSALDRFQEAVFARMRGRYREPVSETFCKLVALKAANGLAADYHFRRRHTVLVSRPIQLQIDPTNACHLQCPSCLHTANVAWASRFDWPSATLSVPRFEEFCNEFAPFATAIALFRDGEPLLHKRFPEFVALARSYLLYTLTSTNLSMRIDAAAVVASGLDRLVAAIDGGSEATYSRYRRGGEFGLVLDNLRAIVAERKAQSSQKPWLVWQFLAFEHNAYEIETAAGLAREIGVDQFLVARPNPVDHDDPNIHVAECAPFGTRLFSEYRHWHAAADHALPGRNAVRIERLFREPWVERYRAAAQAEGQSGPDSTCRWLYYSLTMDAARRVTPCCLPPMGPPEPRHLVYARFDGANTAAVVNSPDAILARRQCRSGGSSELPAAPYCLTCDANPESPIPLDLSGYLKSVDQRQALPESIHAAFAAAPLFAQ